MWVAGGTLLLGVGLHVLLPYAVNIDTVKAKIVQTAEERLPGRLDAVHLEPRLFPLPHLMLTDLRYTYSDKVDLHIDRVDLHPHIVPLIAGRIHLKSMAVQSPRLSIELPVKRQDATATKPPSPSDRYPDRYAEVKAVMARLPAGWRLHIVDGRVVLNRDGSVAAQFHGVDIRAAETDGRLIIETDGTEDTAGQFQLGAQLDRHSLHGKGEVTLTDFRFGLLAQVVEEKVAEKLPQGRMDLVAVFESRGVDDFEASIVCSSRELLVERDDRRVRLENIGLEGAAHMTPRGIDVSLSRLQMASPGVDLGGKLEWGWGGNPEAPPLRLSVQARETDVTRLRGDLLVLFPELQTWTLFEVIREGKLVSMALESSGASWGRIGKLKQLSISGRAADSRIVVPGAGLDLARVSGEWQLDNGDLIVKSATAQLGNTRGTDGTLTLGLTEEVMPIDLDIRLDADLAELAPRLKGIISDPEVLAEIDRIETLDGSASGRLSLHGDLDHLEIRAEAAHLNAKIDYRRLPATVALQGGPLTIHMKRGRLDLEGTLAVQEELSLSTRFTVDGQGLDIQQLRLADAHSSAEIALRYDKAGRALAMQFGGRLDAKTFADLWPQSGFGGRVKGQFTARVPLDRPLASVINGHLEAVDLDLPVAALEMIHITHADAAAREGVLSVNTLDLMYAGQSVGISGTVRTVEEQLLFDLKAGGETLDLDPILAAVPSKAETPPGDTVDKKGNTVALRGTIEVAFDQVTYKQRMLDDVEATVALGGEETDITLHRGDLCGIATQGHLHRTPQGMRISSLHQAEKETLQYTSGCLLDENITERVLGTYTINGRLDTSGQTEAELIRHLQGDVVFEVADGRVINVGNVGLFTNILEYLSINRLVTGDHPSMRKRDFKYDALTLALHLQDGFVKLEKAEVLSAAVNMVAEGTVDIASRQLDLTVLVSPLTTVDTVIRYVPVIGKILKGTLVAIPIGVKGPLHDPKIIPLSPKAVGARLTGILGGILKAPVQLVEPIFRQSEPKEPRPQKETKQHSAPQPPVRP